jgi:hypothetical protein
MAGTQGNRRSGHPRQTFVGSPPTPGRRGNPPGTPDKLRQNAIAPGEFRALARRLLFHGRCGPQPNLPGVRRSPRSPLTGRTARFRRR